MENKIKKEQLDTILNQQKELNNLLTNIGALESQKHGALHRLAEVNKSIEDFKSLLQQMYGDININIEDGTYTFIEQPETSTEEVELQEEK